MLCQVRLLEHYQIKKDKINLVDLFMRKPRRKTARTKPAPVLLLLKVLKILNILLEIIRKYFKNHKKYS